MSKVIINEKKVEEVLTKGVEAIYPTKEGLKKLLMSGKRIRLYCGFDPSAPSLHIGNAILINKLSQFQELGHEVIFLIGDFTGMIGDPTDKQAARKKMTREEVGKNAKGYKKQAAGFLKFSGNNPARALYNGKWSDKITFKDLIEIASNFTVQQMIQRDMFQRRIKEEKPIYLHEFLYPVAQGYDSVVMDVDLEIGGNDQTFNMLCGRDLMKAVKQKEKFVLTMKLLADEKGKKMGKSEGNAVFLDQKPAEMYGSIMSWTDGMIINGFELCTKLPMEEIRAIRRELADGKANPRDIKMRLAYEFVKINFGEKKAKEAEDNFIKTFQKKEIPDEIENKKIGAGNRKIADLLVETGLARSKSEARRLVGQGGVKIDGETVDDPNAEVEIGNREKLIQRGKRQFVKVSAN